jgi:hypothetical protein
MGVPKPTRDKAEGDRDHVAPDARNAGDVSESREADVQDLPRNEAPRTRPLGGPDADPRAGETAAQDRVPTADDINLEATLLQRSTGASGVGLDEWRQAQRRFEPGIEDVRDEATPVRGPSTSASTGRVVTERETVADDEADADATDRNAARQDDPDRA